ncbi:transporter associated domain-containing protein [Aliiroseovarius lamellibrachiae]|uniref:transporter associated domain-containing protein n=1 Tax=Aliiroseovarius lamellibrachiae TaxID=1924933 RepID=UPI001BE0DB2C|nr:hemolysin family protein [Aliiroseovarius lamellibrachiae]MBT2130381.1 hemolysin family protein [Aliiroseovarius lamellibrachiae]
MSDSNDGSSSAAQRARHPEDESAGQSKSGFFSRVIGALSPTDTGDLAPNDLPQALPGMPQQTTPGMVNLRRMRVEDVMIPKSEILSVSVDIKKTELVELFRESGLTRLPVFDGTLDSPVGLVHLKDFALTHGFGGTKGGTSERYALKNLLRPLLYAPPSMPIGVLLQKMQTERIHMALVIDEYGGVDGLVTLEDLIEQVIGEIEDEHDTEESALWLEEKPGCYLVEAKAPLDEFEAAIGVRLMGEDDDDEEIDTLGGLVFLLSGHVPARGEVILHPDGPEFEVVDADPRRIKRLRVRIPAQQDG